MWFDAVSIETSTDSFFSALRNNARLWTALERLSAADLPEWYLGAGCIAQTYWNHVAGNDPNYGIRDYDIVYFSQDTSPDSERTISNRVAAQLADLHINVDVKNQARVHLWYPDRFGYRITPYVSAEDAIATWPTTATAVGITLRRELFSVYAPLGLMDLLNHIVRPNRVQITRAIYQSRVERWSQYWPFLTFLGWDEGVGEEASRSIALHV